jgi:adenylate cyclase
MLRADELIGLGTLYALSGPPAAAEEVAVVGISQSTFESLGVSDELDEWPRIWHARILERLRAAAPAAILFDVSFREPRDPEHDAALAAAISAAGNVILLERTAPMIGDDARAAATAGIVLETAPFTLPSVPIRLSQFWIFDRMGANVPNLPALGLQAYATDSIPALRALFGLGDDATTLDEGDLDVGVPLDTTVRTLRDAALMHGLSKRDLDRLERTDDGARTAVIDALVDMYTGPSSGYLRYYGPPGAIETIPYEDVLSGAAASALAGLAGKIVFIGISEITPPNQQDVFYSVYSDASGRNLSGVEIGATAFANLLHREIVRPLGMWTQIVMLALWGVLITVCAMARSHRIAWALCLSAAAGYVVATAAAFSLAQLWLPTLVPLAMQVPIALLLAGLWKYVAETGHRQRVEAALDSYAPQGAVHGLDQAPIARDRGRRLIEAACIVTDVHGYTAFAERLPADELADLMNEYYESLFDVVASYGGIVTDTAGDSMVAVWECEEGVPMVRACAAAQAIDITVGQFNERHPDSVLATGIGVDRGEIMMANIGSERRFNFHAVGNAVNTAARIQGLTRRLGANVLASARGHVRDDELHWRYLGEFWLAGKTECVGIFELRERQIGATARSDDEFSLGLAAFRDGDLAAARAWFERAPDDDGPAAFYRHYCEGIAEPAARGDWDGRVFMSAK